MKTPEAPADQRSKSTDTQSDENFELSSFSETDAKEVRAFDRVLKESAHILRALATR